VFERFTERAREAVVLAQEEARALGHHAIDTEHLLLGLLGVKEGVAARALAPLGVVLEDARDDVVRALGRRESEAQSGQIPFTPDAKNALESGLREALALKHNYVGAEHLLLGLLRRSECGGARILRARGTDADRIRENLFALLDRSRREQGSP
jgi:ATP-dependent Clp protease ATP-binding subunit ClpC